MGWSGWAGINQEEVQTTELVYGLEFVTTGASYDNEIQVIKFLTLYYLNRYSISFYLILYHYSLNIGDFIMIEETIYSNSSENLALRAR